MRKINTQNDLMNLNSIRIDEKDEYIYEGLIKKDDASTQSISYLDELREMLKMDDLANS